MKVQFKTYKHTQFVAKNTLTRYQMILFSNVQAKLNEYQQTSKDSNLQDF